MSFQNIIFVIFSGLDYLLKISSFCTVLPSRGNSLQQRVPLCVASPGKPAFPQTRRHSKLESVFHGVRAGRQSIARGHFQTPKLVVACLLADGSVSTLFQVSIL